MLGSICPAFDLASTSKFLFSFAEGEGKPPTLSELEKRLLISHGQVDRHLKTLIEEGSVTKVRTRYHANLDYLDGLLLSRAHFDRGIEIIETCLMDLKCLGMLLDHLLT